MSAIANDAERQARRFLRRAAATACCAALAVLVLNAVVDPLNLFQRRDTPAWLGCAPGFRLDAPYALPLAVRDLRPEVLLTGTSRIVVGHEASDPLLSAAGASAFNLGLAGASISMMERSVALSTAEYVPRTLIVGLSLGSFLTGRHSDTATEPISRVRAWMHNLFSFASTRTSIATLTDRTRCREPDRWPNGDSLSLEKRAGDRTGREPLARAMDAFFVGLYSTTSRKMHRERRTSVLDDAQTAAFSTLLSRQCARGTRLLLFFEPSHARLLEIIWATGLWNDYERLKRLVTQEVTRARQTGCKVDLWDFSGYNRYTSEAFSDPEILYFWESSHYTHALGRLMTRRLLGVEEKGSELGRRLTADNVDAHLAELRTQRERFVLQNPAVADYVEGMVRSLPIKK